MAMGNTRVTHVNTTGGGIGGGGGGSTASVFVTDKYGGGLSEDEGSYMAAAAAGRPGNSRSFQKVGGIFAYTILIVNLLKEH